MTSIRADPADTGLIEGYASLFQVADLGHDMVMPGAFTDTLRRKGAEGIRMLWQHDPAEVIGTWLDLRETALGLHVRGTLNTQVQRGREALALLHSGAINGLSIGFETKGSQHPRGSTLRRLTSIDLWEISLVTFPMLPQARVHALKRRHGPTLPLMGSLRAGGLRSGAPHGPRGSCRA